MRVLVLGGSGFVGRALLRQLSAQGHQLTVPVRRPERQRDLRLIPNVSVLPIEHFSDLQLRKLLRGHDAVINLVGILHESGKATFRSVHIDLVRKLAIACEVEGVKRLIHISALGASVDAPSRYLRSKAEAEAVLASSDLEITILRPSVMFGEGDNFINAFASLLSKTPLMPVVCPKSLLSPVWVEDVAKVISVALSHKSSIGQTYELCGERVYSLMELWQLIAEMRGCKVDFMALPDFLSRWTARLMGLMPTPMMTYDNYLSLQVPSVCHQPMPFGFSAMSLRSYALQVLAKGRVRQRYDDMRQIAGRDVSDRIT
jgi:uncharacterized protein YbjT (DUF2867 family)